MTLRVTLQCDTRKAIVFIALLVELMYKRGKTLSDKRTDQVVLTTAAAVAADQLVRK